MITRTTSPSPTRHSTDQSTPPVLCARCRSWIGKPTHPTQLETAPPRKSMNHASISRAFVWPATKPCWAGLDGRSAPQRRGGSMERTIVATFETRRDAETAVEHLVQEHGVKRTDIFVQAKGEANSAGVRPAGADRAAMPVLANADNPSWPERSNSRSIVMATKRRQWKPLSGKREERGFGRPEISTGRQRSQESPATLHSRPIP